MTESSIPRRNIGLWLAVLGAAACTVVSIRLYAQVGLLQPLWPLPALYLLEMTALCWLGAATLRRSAPRSAAIVCAVAGALTGFSILGAFSIGIFYAPIALLFAAAGALAAWRTRLPLLSALISFAVAGIAQAALMLILLRLQPSVLILAAVPG